MIYHMHGYYGVPGNHSSHHFVASTPILDSVYNRYYSYCGPELLMERWIHADVALPLIRSCKTNSVCLMVKVKDCLIDCN
jgi:hypothetical protein